MLFAIRADVANFVNGFPGPTILPNLSFDGDLGVNRICTVFDQGCHGAPTTAVIALPNAVSPDLP